MKKSKNNNIILGFSFQFYVFGFSLSNGSDSSVQKLLFFCFCFGPGFDIQNNICTQHVLNLSFFGDSVNNLSSYCGLTDSKMRASDKDLHVLTRRTQNLCCVSVSWLFSFLHLVSQLSEEGCETRNNNFPKSSNKTQCSYSFMSKSIKTNFFLLTPEV